jgi:hypothetical protein
MKDDIRLKILAGINGFGHTTEQKPANEFLSEIKTYCNTEDLGTIVEAIKELRADGLIKETRGANVIDTITTSGAHKTWKNPKRFMEELEDAPKIKELFLFCTLKGKQFLIEHEKLQIDLTLSKWQKKWFWPVAISGVIGLAIAIISLIVTFFLERTV